MIRKTVRLRWGRTSIKLEPEFWSYLQKFADNSRINLPSAIRSLVPEDFGGNVASLLRVWCLEHAQDREWEYREFPEPIKGSKKHEKRTDRRSVVGCPNTSTSSQARH